MPFPNSPPLKKKKIKKKEIILFLYRTAIRILRYRVSTVVLNVRRFADNSIYNSVVSYLSLPYDTRRRDNSGRQQTLFGTYRNLVIQR